MRLLPLQVHWLQGPSLSSVISVHLILDGLRDLWEELGQDVDGWDLVPGVHEVL